YCRGRVLRPVERNGVHDGLGCGPRDERRVALDDDPVRAPDARGPRPVDVDLTLRGDLGERLVVESGEVAVAVGVHREPVLPAVELRFDAYLRVVRSRIEGGEVRAFGEVTRAGGDVHPAVRAERDTTGSVDRDRGDDPAVG